tara:strand:- start:388 stop:741 length:354 start_codon:yes stop_codon:yes gene_type:complete
MVEERSYAEIEYAFESFVEGCNNLVRKHREENLPSLPPLRIEVSEGRVYWKLVRTENGRHSSAYAFVRKSDGAIFKPATWHAPFTKGPSAIRGYVNDSSNGLDSVTPYGTVYANNVR